MNIKEYLAKKNLRVLDMASDLGVSACYLSSICSGKLIASKQLAKHIELYTKGAIKSEDLIRAVDARNEKD